MLPGSRGSPSPGHVNLDGRQFTREVPGNGRTDHPWYPTRNLSCIVDGFALMSYQILVSCIVRRGAPNDSFTFTIGWHEDIIAVGMRWIYVNLNVES